MTLIRDPNTNQGMHVDANSRAHVESVTETERDHAAFVGYKFNINTGDINISNATKLTTLYVKNTGTYDIVLDALIYNLGNSTSGTGDIKIDVIRNPTAGDIITNANNVLAGPGVESNQNFGSTNVMTGLFYKGAVGETAVSGSDGVSVSTRSAAITGRIVVSLGALVLPLGSSIAIDYTPPTSNSAQLTQWAIAAHVRHPSVVAP